jgi:glyoxylase-like metal-dependent hydrolase (beta-lactamase superfamily II)
VAIGAEVWGPAGVECVGHVLADGDAIITDEGNLITVSTPGHTSEHLSFYWEAQQALFAGDHLLGKGNTTWVADYPGCVSDYLNSIAQLRMLSLSVIYPAHGPPLENPTEVLNRFESHRLARIQQVEEALEQHPSIAAEELVAFVYGDALPNGMERAASQSLEALREHVQTLGKR